MPTWPWQSARTERHSAPGDDVLITDAGGCPLDQLLDFCRQAPVEAALLGEHVEALRTQSTFREQMLVAKTPDGIGGVVWIGGNVVPLRVVTQAFAPFAEKIRRSRRRYSSIAGPADDVLGLWDELAPYGPPPREVRDEQPSLMIDGPPLVPAAPEVRVSVPREVDTLLPACVAMFTEEVGYSPLRGGRGYERRIQSLVDGDRSLVWMSDDPCEPEVIFKAEVGTVAFGVAQVQGVWVNPAYRGRGYAAAGMAAVVEHVREYIAPVVSLYVNSYNAAALAVYRKVGFHQVGSYATVLF